MLLELIEKLLKMNECSFLTIKISLNETSTLSAGALCKVAGNQQEQVSFERGREILFHFGLSKSAFINA